ncbi:hypothetical protein FACS1894200_03170 [Spirochaetia bacterium]|nr:hypothetical protein FACS1894200_03170 [Spirochaetia bacterium]
MGYRALTPAEKMARYRERKKTAGLKRIELWQAPLENIDTNNELVTSTTDKSTLQKELMELKAAAVPIDTNELERLQNENNELKQALAETESKYQALLQPKPAAVTSRRKKTGRFDVEKERAQRTLACCNYLLSKGNEWIGISKELLSNFGITKAKVDELGITYLEQSFAHDYLE